MILQVEVAGGQARVEALQLGRDAASIGLHD